MIRELLFDTFEARYGRVLIAGDGREGWNLFQRESVDIILSDVRMPGGDGIDLLKKVRNIETKNTKFCLVSGFSDAPIEDLYFFGADALFPKPFSIKTMIATMAEMFLSLEEKWQLPRILAEPQARLKRQVNLASGDIARGGLFFPGRTDLRPDTIVGFELEVGDWGGERIEGYGAVRWVRAVPDQGRGPSGCGIEILSITGEARTKLSNKIHEICGKTFIPLK